MLQGNVQTVLLNEGTDVLTELNTLLRVISKTLIKECVVLVVQVIDGQSCASTLIVTRTSGSQIEVAVIRRIKLTLQLIDSLGHTLIRHNIQVMTLVVLLKELDSCLHVVASVAIDNVGDTRCVEQYLQLLIGQLNLLLGVNGKEVFGLLVLGLTLDVECARLSETCQRILCVWVLSESLVPELSLTAGNLCVLGVRSLPE